MIPISECRCNSCGRQATAMWPHYTDLGLTFKTYCQECYEKVKAEAEEQAIKFYKQVKPTPQ